MLSAGISPAARRLLLLCVLLAVGLLAWQQLPLTDWLQRFSQYLQQLGPLAPLIYALVYIVATLIMIPLAPLAIAAGYLFGLAPAFSITLPAATIGALLAFLLSRYLFARSCRQFIQPYPRVRAVEHSIAAQGWLIVLLLRVSPIVPSHLLNYLCGITEIPVRHYVWATFVGKAPLILMLSYIGALAAQTLSTAEPMSAPYLLVYGAGLIFTLLAAWLIMRRARHELAEQGMHS